MADTMKALLRGPYRWLTLRWFGFKAVGRAVYVNHRVRVDNASSIILGNEVHVHYGSELVAGAQSSICLDDGCRVGPYATLQATVGFIRMGTNGYIGPQSILRGDGGLTIGSDVLISPQVVIMSANHIFADVKVPIREQLETRRGIVIEDDVWLGAGVKVMDGVHIGRGTVVGAGAVVTSDIPPYSVAVGVPARVIRTRVFNEYSLSFDMAALSA